MTMMTIKNILDQTTPGPLKCFCAPSHQILAKSAPPKGGNRNRAELVTKVRKSSIKIWGTFNSKSLFQGARLRILQ